MLFDSELLVICRLPENIPLLPGRFLILKKGGTLIINHGIMERRKITIYGSCVTRDAFNLAEAQTRFVPERYFARSSLASMANPEALFYQSEWIILESGFQKKMLEYELSKTFLKSEIDPKCYLIVDFIDERFDLIIWEDHFLTRSNEFIRSGLDLKLGGRIVNRFAPESVEAWKQGCRRFSEKILSHLPQNKVIIHKAYWMDRYRKNEVLHPFGLKTLRRNRNFNRLVRLCYEELEQYLPQAHIIDLSRRGFAADAQHDWGLSPFHYERAYYRAFIDQLTQIVQEDGDGD